MKCHEMPHSGVHGKNKSNDSLSLSLSVSLSQFEIFFVKLLKVYVISHYTLQYLLNLHSKIQFKFWQWHTYMYVSSSDNDIHTCMCHVPIKEL